MISVNADTLVVGAAELRKQMPYLAKEIKTKTVIVTKKGKPIAVLEDFDEYTQKNRLIETFEDLVLGHMAKDRWKNSNKSDYIAHEDMMKKLGISL